MKTEHTYLEPARSIPLLDRCDVVVLGAGPAGFGAALCAAREGASTVLIEQTGEVGGVATGGLMSHWTGNTKGGLYQELLERSSLAYVEKDYDYFPLIAHEHLKNVMTEMLLEAGVQIRLYTAAVQPMLEQGRVCGVICESKSGRTAQPASVVIDCTGDGDIAARAGARYTKGRENDGSMQPMTLMIQLAGVDRSKVTYLTEFGMEWTVNGQSLTALARSVLPAPAGHLLIYPTVYPGNVILNMTNCIGVDGTNAADLTRAHIQCRRQMAPIVEFLRKNAPGFENAYVIKTAAQIGVRETRHFEGMQTITEQDILAARVFDDWVVTKAHFNFDVHNMSGSGLDATGCQMEFSQPNGYTIPYGCLVPKEVDGLLLAGRCISGTHMAHSNYRVMPICVNMGQAAGVAAALCVRKGIQPRRADVRAIQQRLRTMGVEP